MASAEYCRKEAQRCLQYAEAAKEATVRRRWHQLADDYIRLAEQIEAKNADPATDELSARSQPQPEQQPQSRKRD